MIFFCFDIFALELVYKRKNVNATSLEPIKSQEKTREVMTVDKDTESCQELILTSDLPVERKQ